MMVVTILGKKIANKENMEMLPTTPKTIVDRSARAFVSLQLLSMVLIWSSEAL